MSLAPGEDSWIKFHDQRGVHRGSIVDTERGAKLESGSGDCINVTFFAAFAAAGIGSMA